MKNFFKAILDFFKSLFSKKTKKITSSTAGITIINEETEKTSSL